MREKNTLSKKSYIFWHLLIGMALLVSYRKNVFIALEATSYKKSAIILWVLFFGIYALGIAACFERMRNRFTLATNVLVPFEIYLLWSYHPYMSVKFMVIYTGAVVLFHLAALVFFHWIERRTGLEELKKTVQRAIAGTLAIVSLSLCGFTAVVWGGAYLGYTAVRSSVPADSGAVHTEYNIGAKIEIVNKFKNEIWVELSVSEKTDALQTAANIERNYLGLPHELRVAYDFLPSTVMATYRHKTRTITINLEQLVAAEGSLLLEAVCHEAYHAYQHNLCEVLNKVDDKYGFLDVFEAVQEYRKEFADYTSGSESMTEYYYQRCEIDSRIYAAARREKYFETIKFFE